jgi:hypothetical protein
MTALPFLLHHQEPDGHFRSTASPYLRPVEHAAATQVLSVMTQSSSAPRFYEAAVRATDYMLSHQQTGGGWGDGYSGGKRRSTPITASQMEALFAAAQAGVRVPEITAALQRAARDLLATQNADTGRFGHYFRGVGPAMMTGHALAGLQWAGWGLSHPARRGWLDLVSPVAAGNVPLPLLATRHTLYAAAQQGGAVARIWTEQVFSELLAAQSEEGYWEGPGSDAPLGRAYATAQCAWMLSGFRQDPRHFKESPAPEPGPPFRVVGNGSTVLIMPSTFLLPDDRFLLDREWANWIVAAQSVSGGPTPRALAYELTRAAERHAPHPLPPDILESLHRLYPRLVIPDSTWNTLHPWAIALFILGDAAERKEIDLDAMPDEFIFRHSVSSAPAIREVVTSTAYVKAITALPDELGLDLLRRALAHRDRIPTLIHEAAEAWRVGDPVKLEHTVARLADLAGPSWKLFIEPLDQIWREEIDRVLQIPGTHLIVIPLIHLPGLSVHH